MPDELLRIFERRVVRSDFNLGQDGYDIALASGFPKRVLERLLQHVSDPAGRPSHQNAERKWRYLVARLFIPHQLVTDLRAVAVHHYDAPSLEREVDDWAEARASMSELIADGRAFAWRRQRVSAYGNYGSA